MNQPSIGHFEEIVMLTVAVLFDEAYGIAIKEELENRLGRKVSIGAMRTALKRLEQKGYLDSSLGEATPVRGGKRKRFFKVTNSGREILLSVRDTRNNMWDAIPPLAFDFNWA